jgi:glycosyltransferase involved in cell wall biosynthesis
MDSGNMDGREDSIRKYDQHLDYWISEPDRGMYEAINKGINRATRDLIGVLNSDERYAAGALQKAISIFTTHPGVDASWGTA